MKTPEGTVIPTGGQLEPAFARIQRRHLDSSGSPDTRESAMIAPACPHTNSKKHGKDRHGNQRFKCLLCGCTWTEKKARGPLGPMRLPVATAKTILQLLLEGSSIRSAERITGVHRDTICRLIVRFGDACQVFMHQRMQRLELTD